MINKQLFKLIPNYKRTLHRLVLTRLHVMIFNVSFLKGFIELLVYGPSRSTLLYLSIMVILKLAAIFMNQRLMDKSSLEIKSTLHEGSIHKIIENYASIKESYSQSQVVQTFSEGIEQLEAYFVLFLPQLFYALLAPLIIFINLSRYNLKLALILVICLPLIPLAIFGVQKLANSMQVKYWNSYTSLGEQFLDFIKGLSTLKYFNADQHFQDVMDYHAYSFRSITMKVLGMQLINLTVMDLIAYGCTVIVSLLSIHAYRLGNLSLVGMLSFIVLSYEFYAPLRQLGSYFHVAMTGIAASKTLLGILDVQSDNQSPKVSHSIIASNISKEYGSRVVVNALSLKIDKGDFIGIVGESGSGKSTVLKLMTKEISPTSGSISLPMSRIIYVGSDSEIFRGSVRFNLDFQQKHTDNQLRELLNKLNLNHINLDEILTENGSNISGGERQRILLGRGLLADADVYCFDEITSSVDIESERIIMDVIKNLKELGKTVILVTHRLKNVTNTDYVLVMDQGKNVGFEAHDTLLKDNEHYQTLWNQQQIIEIFMEGTA